MQLPIVVEMSARHYLYSLPVAALLLSFAGALLWIYWHKRQYPVVVAAVCGGLFLMAAAFVLPPVGWRFQIDKDGIDLRAPFDFMRPGDRISWRDLKAVEIKDSGGRTGFGLLHFSGVPDREIVLTTLEELPAQFAGQLTRLIAENAPEAKVLPSSAAFISRYKISQETDRAPKANKVVFRVTTYAVKDGMGRDME